MSVIYTRDRRKNYTPPPGYVGNAFHMYDGATVRYRASADKSDDIPVEAEKSLAEIPKEIVENLPDEIENKEEAKPKNDGIQINENLRYLAHSISEKIGREELIILLVMLLVVSDGMCVEVLILALVLLAA